MDRHELNRMFDGLAPDPRRERELLRQLLQDDMRRKRPMKNWKQVVIGAAAAALLVTGATAAVVVPRLNQGFLDYLNVEPEDTEAVVQAESLLLPGAMELDITKEDNGAALHVTQVLRDRNCVMVLADFTAPEGTVLNMGDLDAPGSWMRKGFSLTSETTGCFLDEAGEPMGGGLTGYYNWEVLEDGDPLDEHLTLMLTLFPQMGETSVMNAAALRVPAVNLSYFDTEGFDSEAVYYGDWTVQIPLPQQDIGSAQQLDYAIGELDGARIVVEELYLSPMTMELTLTREGGVDLDSWTDENEAAQIRWLSLANDAADPNNVVLTAKDGETVSLEWSAGGGVGTGRQVAVFRLSQVTDPAKFQGGTLTLNWACGKAVIPLNSLVLAEP